MAGPQVLQDPMPIKKGIDVEKKGSAYQIHLQADGIKAHGLGDLKINYLRATRRFGLKNLRVNITISTDLRLEGRYKLKVMSRIIGAYAYFATKMSVRVSLNSPSHRVFKN